jgi:hypothetical protein
MKARDRTGRKARVMRRINSIVNLIVDDYVFTAHREDLMDPKIEIRRLSPYLLTHFIILSLRTEYEGYLC